MLSGQPFLIGHSFFPLATMGVTLSRYLAANPSKCDILPLIDPIRYTHSGASASHSGAVALESVRRWRKSLNWQKSRATRSEGGYAPNLWPVWRAVTLGILTASLVGWLIYYFLSVSPASAKTAPIEVVRTTLTMMAGLAAVLTGIWAYRRQRLSEADGLRADDDQLTQRYSTAAEKLGHEKAAVRLAGVIAMARLADDWSKQRQQCIDVLCAYLRMPTEQDGDLSERQVRATIVRTIAAHLRKDLAISWARYDFDFTGAALHNADFNQARFSGKYTRFDGARFSGEYTGFDGATFSGGTPADAATEKASFLSATVVWGPITPRTLPSPAPDTV